MWWYTLEAPALEDPASNEYPPLLMNVSVDDITKTRLFKYIENFATKN